MKFAPEYVSCVLAENFADARRLFLSELVAIHYAHLVMLADRGIVSAGDAAALRKALDAIPLEKIAAAEFDGRCEDLFYFVNREIEQACGADVAGRLHTARSRNDIDMTMYRMRQRGRILAVIENLLGLRESLIEAGRPPPANGASAAHPHPARPAVHRRALPAGRDRAGGARRDPPAGRLRIHQPVPARRLRDHRHRLRHRPLADERPARLLRPDRQHLRQHRERGLPARERGRDRRDAVGPRPVRAGHAALVHARSSPTSASATASCRAAASCRRSATRWRSSTRAPSAARRSARRTR